MGIDIYLEWELMTDEDKEAQLCGFDITKGATGYLREAYHGEPYPSMILMPETFDRAMEPVHIPAATLRERLPAAIEAAIERERTIYDGEAVDEDTPCVASYREFVEKAERLEAAGQRPLIVNSH